MKRRDFVKTVGMGAAAAALPDWMPPPGAAADRPNIVVIMADDMGFSDIGCYGGEIDTPNIDRLAEGGQRFTQFYNNAKCAPTRASLLTGLYSQQAGVHGPPARMKNSVTIAEVLKEAGYRTLMTGKWHADEIPVERGFDRYYGLADGCCNFFNPGNKRSGEPKPARKRVRRWAIDDEVYHPYTPEDPDFYTTDAFTDYAVDYLEEYSQEDRPFFLYVGYTAPHYPLHARPEDIAKYRGRYMKGWDALRRERYQRQLDMGLIPERWKLAPRDDRVPSWENVEDRAGWAFEALQDRTLGTLTWENVKDRELWDLKMAVYAAMVDRMDQNIGRILDTIREQGEEENTLVLFLADNGGCAELVHLTPDVPPGRSVDSYRTVDPPWANAQNTPFRKYKRWDHEGGISTPLVAHWPGVIEPGTVTRQVGHVIDVMATCAEIGGAEYPLSYKGRSVLPLEGKSLLPVFRGEERNGHDALYWQFDDCRAVREGKWKLVEGGDRPWELYDMEADRTELHNLAKKHPDRVQSMARQWKAWAERAGVRS